MKRLFIFLLVCAVCNIFIFSDSDDPESLKLKGFFLGMEKSEVNKVFQKLKSDQVAKYISIEASEFRDLIQLDNEFSSMGNKIELNYDESGKVTYIKFQYKTVAILFEASDMSASEFVEKFRAEYNFPEMEFQDMGIIKTWSYSDEARRFSISIDDSQNITLQSLKVP